MFLQGDIGQLYFPDQDDNLENKKIHQSRRKTKLGKLK